jgi:hypothetical protein
MEIIGRLLRFADSDFVFSVTAGKSAQAYSDTKYRIDKLLSAHLPNMEGWVLHDIRRTVATGMADLGIAPHVLDRVLNHVSGTISGVARIYNRHEYASERKAALDAWGRWLSSCPESVPGKAARWRPVQQTASLRIMRSQANSRRADAGCLFLRGRLPNPNLTLLLAWQGIPPAFILAYVLNLSTRIVTRSRASPDLQRVSPRCLKLPVVPLRMNACCTPARNATPT